jgi:NAD(P)H dehydrogenase (quinone)
MEKMRYLVIYAHPRPDSFSAAIRHTVVDTLALAGHQVDLLDLYAIGFDPVLSAEAHAGYFTPERNRAGVEDHVARLERAQAVVLIYPTWWFGYPAILKGYFDRVWLPGVAFDIGRIAPRGRLNNITKLAVITTYGSPRWYIRWFLRDPMRKIVKRGVGALCNRSCEQLFLALYGMDRTTAARRQRFIETVRRRLATF